MALHALTDAGQAVQSARGIIHALYAPDNAEQAVMKARLALWNESEAWRKK
jgi:hypothetical protein